jgi:ABC-2 type transport system permease protein
MLFLKLLKHELRMLWLAPSTYLAGVLFLLLMQGMYLLAISSATQRIEDVLPATLFFHVYFLPVLFLIPLLTMRSLAEEKRMGTLETLITTRVGIGSMVVAKYLAAYIFYCLLWALTLTYPFITQSLAPDIAAGARLLDPAPLIGGYAFVFLSGTLFVALGLFCSSLTRSQLVAGMLSFCLLLLLLAASFVLEKLEPGQMASQAWLAAFVDYMNTPQHLEDFSRGVLDSRPFFFYLSNTAVLLGLTCLSSAPRA